MRLTRDSIGIALAEASTGDVLLIQNETNGQVHAARMAKSLGMKVVYAAAPFEAEAVRAVIGQVDLLVLNAVEAGQLETALGRPLHRIGVADVVVTLGADGCRWIACEEAEPREFAAHAVDAVDTTGAGDTFTGYLVAGLDRGFSMAEAIGLAMKAAALMVMREGTRRM